MKILWLSNCVLKDGTKTTGTWLYAMAKLLTDSGKVELFNITSASGIDDIQETHLGQIKQWVLPQWRWKTLNNGLPSKSNINKIQKIVESVNPDIIHIWGMEAYWGLLYSRGYIKGNVLLDIQGVKSYYYYYYGGLSFSECLQCIGLKEIIKPQISIFCQKRAFKKWGKYEDEMMKHFKYISTQSDWVRAYINSCNTSAQIFNTKIPLRDAFLHAKKWNGGSNNGTINIYTSSSGATSYKGVHDLIRAIKILKFYYPTICLNIAGDFQYNMPLYRKSGYTKFLLKLIKSCNLEQNVVFLGSLTGHEIVMEMLKANIVVVPSHIETYCLALAEAMQIGIPCVVSYAGAMSELAKDEESALFYSPGDFVKCAYQINRLLQSKELSERLSAKSIELSKIRNDNENILKTQLNIYQSILKNHEYITE